MTSLNYMHRIAALFTLMAIVFATIPVVAQTNLNEVAEVSKSIVNVQGQIEKLEQEIKGYKAEVVEIDKQQNTLTNKLKAIDTERKKLSTDVKLTEKEIESTNLTLGEIREGVRYAEGVIGIYENSISETFRSMAVVDDISFTEVFFSDSSLGDAFQEYNDLRLTREHLRTRINDLRLVRVDLNIKKRSFVSEQEELQELKEKIVAQKEIEDQKKIEQQGLLEETQYEEEKYQSLIASREALRKAFEEELFEYESRLKFILDPTALPKRGSAPLSWPLDQIVVTQMFGAKTGPHRTYANGHSGTDFRARTSVPTYAAADGIIQGVGNTDTACRGASYGKWVLIKFDNNLSAIYAHLSITSVHEGQRVKRGQTVGWTGNTGRSTAPHLHFAVLAGVDATGANPVEVKGAPSKACAGKTLVQPRASRNAYLDSLDYLPPTTAANYKAGISR